MYAYNLEPAKKKIVEKLKNGDGQGEEERYRAWTKIYDFSSAGFASRVPDIKYNGRVVHLFSTLEYNYWLLLRFMFKFVVDIYEQYPLLPLEETIEIANDLGIRHPTEQGRSSNIPKVITVDFLIKFQHESLVWYEAHSVKKSSDLIDERVLEKLEIERLYKRRRNITWKLATEHQMPSVWVQNMELLSKDYDLSYQHLEAYQIEVLTEYLTNKVIVEPLPLAKICYIADKHFGLEAGKSLSVAYHLISRHKWLVDLKKPINASLPLVLLGTNF